MKLTKGWIALLVMSYLVIFSVGFIISKLVSIPGVYLGLEINPTHLISILATIFIAIFISIIFDFHKEKRKVEKSLIFQRLDEANEIIEKTHDRVEEGSVPTPVVHSSNKRLRSTVNCIFEVMKECKIKTQTGASEVGDLLKVMHDLMTNTPAIEEGAAEREADIRVNDGVYYYGQAREGEINAAIGVLKNNLFKLQIQINNS